MPSCPKCGAQGNMRKKWKMAGRPDVDFIIPQTRSIAANMVLYRRDGSQIRTVAVDLIPSNEGDPLLEKYVAYRYPRTVSEKRVVSGKDEKVACDGREAGKKLVIHKGISERKRNRRRLIGENAQSR